MSDQLIDGVLRALNANHEKLLAHLRELRASERDEGDNESRSSKVLRRKPTDDEPGSLDLVALSNTKRKSVYSRKVRPQSSLDGPSGNQGNITTVISTVEDEDEDVSVDEEVEEDRPPSVDSSLNRTDSTDFTDDGASVGSPLNSQASTPSRGSPIRSKPSKKSTTPGYHDPKLESLKTEAPKLEHLAKSRPKPPRSRAVTKAGLRSELIGVDNDQKDIGDFFDNKPVVAKVVPGSAPVVEESKQDKKKKSPVKGLGGLFKGRSQTTKTPTSPTKPSPSIPEVSTEVKAAPRSHSPENELDKSRSEDEKEDVPEPTPKRPPIGGMGMGPPGLGGINLMAEMQAKRKSMNPFGANKPASTSASPAKSRPARPPEPKDTTTSQAQSSVPPAKAPPGGRPLFPPDKSNLKAPQPQTQRSASPQSGEEGAKPKPVPLRPRPPKVMPKPTSSRLSTSPKPPGNRPEAPANSSTSSPATGTTSTDSSKPTESPVRPVSTVTTPAKPSDNGKGGSGDTTATKTSTADSITSKGSTSAAPKPEAKSKVISDTGSKYNRSSSGQSESRSSRSSVDGENDQSASRKSAEAEPKAEGQSEARKSTGAEPQTNGSTKGDKEEFLLYL